MPAQVPGRISAGSAGSTGAEVVSAFNNVRDLIAQVPGLWRRVVVGIVSDVATPWSGLGATITAGTVIAVDTEGLAATDDLKRIDPTGLLDTGDSSAGRLVLLSSNSAARQVVARHAQGGTGEIRTPDGTHWTLTHPGQILALLWDPTTSPKCWQVLGALQTPIGPPFSQSIRLLTWSTAGRPASPAQGDIGVNSSRSRLEFYSGSWQQALSDPDYVGTAGMASGATSYSFSHGLGSIPRHAEVTYECLTSEYSYSVGDEVPIAHGRTSDGSVATAVIWRSNSLVVLQRASPRLLRADSPGSDGALTIPNWRLKARVWR